MVRHDIFEKSNRKTSSLHIPNLGSTLDSIFQRFLDFFFQKSCKNPYYLVSRIFSTPPGKVPKIVSGSEKESKPSLESFRVTKVDHFSLFDHKKIMILSQVRNRFLLLLDFGHLCCFYKGFLYSSL